MAGMKPKFKLRLCAVAVLVWLFLRMTGLTLYLYERSYKSEFTYGPADDDVRRAVADLKADRKPPLYPPQLTGVAMDLVSGRLMRIDSSHKCRDGLGRSFEPIRLLIIIKSAPDHFANRRSIRKTWGWEERFSDVVIRRVFLLGLPRHFDDGDLQAQIDAEQDKNLDLVQGEYVDYYYNNTLKTLLGLGWMKRSCPLAEYALFADDDYYVSIKNVLRFLRRPSTYPEHLKRALLSTGTIDVRESPLKNVSKRMARPVDDDEDEVRSSESLGADGDQMLVGYRFFSKPHRWKLSKFFVPLEEYPYNRFPPYIAAGAYLVSRSTVFTLYFASLYVPTFRFDDVYVGLLARKAGITPVHNEHFHFDRPDGSRADVYEFLVATHGYDRPDELESVWNRQRSIGNA